MLSSEIEFAWNSNNAVNQVLLQHLTPAMLKAGTPGGGYSIAQHLAHMVGESKQWGTELEAAELEKLPDLYSNYDNDTGSFDAEMNLDRISAVMTQTRDLILKIAKNTVDTGNLPHSSCAQFLMHMAMHDAHHRGQILLALKTSGFALPEERAFWIPLRA
jgi:uncharacterized damage-inducible protein DinB